MVSIYSLKVGGVRIAMMRIKWLIFGLRVGSVKASAFEKWCELICCVD